MGYPSVTSLVGLLSLWVIDVGVSVSGHDEDGGSQSRY